MKRTEMRALSNRGTMRTPLARASAWLLSRLGEGSCRDAAGWVSAREIEVARSQTGVSRSALNKARRGLLKTGISRNGATGTKARGCIAWWIRRPGTVRCAVPSTVYRRRTPSSLSRWSRPRRLSRPRPHWRYATSAGVPGTQIKCTGPASFGTAMATYSRSPIEAKHDAWRRTTRMSTRSSRSSPTDRAHAPMTVQDRLRCREDVEAGTALEALHARRAHFVIAAANKHPRSKAWRTTRPDFPNVKTHLKVGGLIGVVPTSLRCSSLT